MMKEKTKKRANSIEDIVRKIREDKSFILLPHMGIDGDDLGSMLALSMAFSKLNKESYIVCHEKVPAVFSFLPEIERVKRELPLKRYDCAMLMECTNQSRIPGEIDLYNLADKVINVDHHPNNAMYGDYNYVDLTAAAVGEIVFEILQMMGIHFDKNISLCLYVAILTDTGGFQFHNTTARTHRILADLMEYPIDADEISRKIFRELDFGVLKLKGEVIETLKEECDGKIIWGYISNDMMEKYKMNDEDTQQFIEDLNVIRTSQVVVLFRETKDNKVRVSFRSKTFPVNEIALKYKGGGHVLAAGCTLSGNLHDVSNEVLGTLKERLNNRLSVI